MKTSKDNQMIDGAKSGQFTHLRTGHYFGMASLWERTKPNHLRKIRTGFLTS